MLFMKGTADEPQCGKQFFPPRGQVHVSFRRHPLSHATFSPTGFSRSIVALLKEHDAEFSTFNILADDQVRQGLKTFSNWPTFPQLYVAGELIGGLDIVKVSLRSAEDRRTVGGQ